MADEHVTWDNRPAFDLDIPKDVAEHPATYVTVSSISYSLVAPRFHPASRWVNISTQIGVADKSPDALRVQGLIAAPGPLRLLFPTLPGGQLGEVIDPKLSKAINNRSPI